jgi:putative hydrolase of the HAD superfamily
MMKEYKAVFIDWDDTLGDFHGAAKRALEEMYNKYRLDQYFTSQEEFVTLYKPHNLELWALYGQDKVSKEYLSFDRFFYPLMHGAKILNSAESRVKVTKDLCALATKLSDDFLNLTTAYFALLPGAEDLVRYLAQKYPLTIVTNGFIEVQYEKFDKSGLRDYFTHMVLSEEVGCQKPNPRIFQEALRLNGLCADDVVMIGDSLGSDIQGAKNTGIDQIYVTFGRQQDGDATYVVSSLEDVKSIL